MRSDSSWQKLLSQSSMALLVAVTACLSGCTRTSTVQELPKGPYPFTIADTPIKVGGGAMTFFSKSPWSGAGPFCAPVSLSDLQAVTVDRYFDDQGKRVPANTPITGLSAWTIKFYGHDPKEGKTSKPSANGISMAGSSAACNGASGVMISPLPTGGDFYKSQIVAGGKFTDSRRFADTSSGCASDRDRCERVAQADFYDDKGKLVGSFYCPDGLCHLSVGN